MNAYVDPHAAPILACSISCLDAWPRPVSLGSIAAYTA